GELVVGWVTTSESSLLYVFVFGLPAYAVNAYMAPTFSSTHRFNGQ
ncbi:hypothetical protein VN97_g10583, partial [Penicillium thymicola]